MTVKFLHTGDWQIGKIFGTVSGDAGALLRAERLKTVQRISRLAAEHRVDAVLVAGDTFETDLVSNDTIHGLLHTMEAFKGPWVFIPGNHDPAVAESVWQRVAGLGCPDNVHLALGPAPVALADGRLFVLPAALHRKHEIEDLTAAWDTTTTPEGAVRVGLAHGTVEGRLPGASEATNPIATDRETRARLDYLALGDWHGTYQISDRTWYAGTPEPDRFKGNDPGNVLLVTIDAPGAKPAVELVRVAKYRWAAVDAELNSAHDLSALEANLAALGEPFDQHIVSLAIAGAVDFDIRENLDRLLSRWRGRFTWLGEDCSRLVARPTDADLDRIDTTGFVRTAIERLRAVDADPSDPCQAHAMEALQLLYQVQISDVENK